MQFLQPTEETATTERYNVLYDILPSQINEVCELMENHSWMITGGKPDAKATAAQKKEAKEQREMAVGMMVVSFGLFSSIFFSGKSMLNALFSITLAACLAVGDLEYASEQCRKLAKGCCLKSTIFIAHEIMEDIRKRSETIPNTPEEAMRRIAASECVQKMGGVLLGIAMEIKRDRGDDTKA